MQPRRSEVRVSTTDARGPMTVEDILASDYTSTPPHRVRSGFVSYKELAPGLHFTLTSSNQLYPCLRQRIDVCQPSVRNELVRSSERPYPSLTTITRSVPPREAEALASETPISFGRTVVPAPCFHTESKTDNLRASTCAFYDFPSLTSPFRQSTSTPSIVSSATPSCYRSRTTRRFPRRTTSSR